MLRPISSMPCGVRTSIFGTALALTSSSTSRSSRWPPLSSLRNFSRVSLCELLSTASICPSGVMPAGRRTLVGAGNRRSSRRSSAFSRALTATRSRASSRTILTEHSARSRIIDSTSADVADLGVARGLDLDEGRLRQPREPSCDFSLADAGRPDHQDILGRDFVAQLGRDVLPPPSIAQRDRHCALSVMLPDDIAVELGDDLARRHYLWNCHRMKTSRRYCGYNSSNTNSSLV